MHLLTGLSKAVKAQSPVLSRPRIQQALNEHSHYLFYNYVETLESTDVEEIMVHPA